MIRTKLSSLFVILLLLNGFLYSQETKDYKQEYNDLTKGITDEQEYHETTSEYFNSMDDKELPLALADISEGEDANFVAYNLVGPNKIRLEEKPFRDNLLTELAIKSNPSNFKIVVIDFFAEYVERDDTESERFNEILFLLSKEKDSPNILRSYAASHGCISKDYLLNKKQLSELLTSNNHAVINGASHSLKKFLRSEVISKTEKQYYVNLLIEIVNQNINDLDKIKNVIYTLGYSGGDEARDVLLKLFINNVSVNPDISESLTYSLSSLADTKVFNTIFTEYTRNKHYDNFGAELTLKEMVSNNNDIVEKLYNEKEEESKLNFLRAVRLMKDKNRSKYLDKVKQSLNSKSEIERLECVKTLHFLLSYEEEVKLFKQHITKEENEEIKEQIYFYVGQ